MQQEMREIPRIEAKEKSVQPVGGRELEEQQIEKGNEEGMEEEYSKLGAPISPTNVIMNSKATSESVRSEMEIGSSLWQVEAVWRRNEMENANGCVQMELIDIPIKHGEAKKPLAEISSKASNKENTGKGKGSRK